MKISALFFFFSFLISSGLLTACGQAGPSESTSGKNERSSRYNLQAPDVYELPALVSEISGLAWDRDNYVFAVDDENGSLFRIKLQKEPAIEEISVGEKKDYEEVVLTNNTIYMLASSGSVVFFENKQPVGNVETATLSAKGRNDFEILVKDPGAPRLLMMCKSCKEDKKEAVSVYAFDLASKTFDEKPVATLKVKEMEERLGKKIGVFKPSGANVHPQTGELYIISSVNQLLVVTDRAFNVKEVHPLQGNHFKQPEGVCFTPEGDLLISNEAAGKGNANLLLFRQAAR